MKRSDPAKDNVMRLILTASSAGDLTEMQPTTYQRQISYYLVDKKKTLNIFLIFIVERLLSSKTNVLYNKAENSKKSM